MKTITDKEGKPVVILPEGSDLLRVFKAKGFELKTISHCKRCQGTGYVLMSRRKRR